MFGPRKILVENLPEFPELDRRNLLCRAIVTPCERV